MRSYSASEPIQAFAANSAGGGKTRFSRSTDSIRLLSERLWLDVCPWLSVPVGIFGECLREWTDSLAANLRERRRRIRSYAIGLRRCNRLSGWSAVLCESRTAAAIQHFPG